MSGRSLGKAIEHGNAPGWQAKSAVAMPPPSVRPNRVLKLLLVSTVLGFRGGLFLSEINFQGFLLFIRRQIALKALKLGHLTKKREKRESNTHAPRGAWAWGGGHAVLCLTALE